MGKVLRLVISGKSVAELIRNMNEALSELNATQQITTSEPSPVTIPHISEHPTAHSDDIAQQMAEDLGNESAPAAAQASMTTATPDVTTPSTTTIDSKGMPWDERIHSNSQARNKDGSWRYRRGVEDSYIEAVEGELRHKQFMQAAASPTTAAAHVPVAAVQPTPPPAFPQTPPVSASPVSTPVPPVPNVPTMPAQAVSSSVPLPQVVPPPMAGVPSAPVAPVGNVQAPAASPAPGANVIPMVAPTSPSTATSAPTQAGPLLAAHTPETFKANLTGILAKLVADGRLTQEYIASLQSYFQVQYIWMVNDTQLIEMFNEFVKHGLIVKAEL